jgi:hypothetical protein
MGRTIDAFDATHSKQCRRHGGAGVSGREHGRCFAVSHRFGATYERGIFLPTHTTGCVFIHLDDFAGFDGGQAVLAEFGGPADENNGDAVILICLDCPGDDLARGFVAAHRINGDGKHVAHELNQSTSTATRFLYQPHAPHTVWGSLAALQRGHRLRAGAESVQADARPARVRAFDFFFFGTAITRSPLANRESVAAPPQTGQLGSVQADECSRGTAADRGALSERSESESSGAGGEERAGAQQTRQSERNEPERSKRGNQSESWDLRASRPDQRASVGRL